MLSAVVELFTKLSRLSTIKNLYVSFRPNKNRIISIIQLIRRNRPPIPLTDKNSNKYMIEYYTRLKYTIEKNTTLKTIKLTKTVSLNVYIICLLITFVINSIHVNDFKIFNK